MQTKSRQWRPWLLQALALGLAIFGVRQIARVLPYRVDGNDFAHYYVSSRLFLAGADLYTTPLQPEYERWGFRYTHQISTPTNPPFLVAVFAPFAMLPPTAAFWGWVTLEFLSLGCVLALIWRLLSDRLSLLQRFLVCAAIIASAPVYWHFFFSQSQLLIAALILFAYWCLRKGWPTSACVAVTTTVWLKLFPVVLVPWFLWRCSREWSVRWKCAGACIAWSAALIVATGLRNWQQFWLHGMKTVEDWIAWQRHFNFTVPSFVKNLVWLFHGFDPQWNQLYACTHVCAIIGAALIVLAYGFCWKSERTRARTNLETEFCLMSIAMLVGISEAWGHYYVMLAFPFAVAVAQRASLGRGLMLGISLTMLNLMGDLPISRSTATGTFLPFSAVLLPSAGLPPWLKFLASYIPLYGLLLLGAFFVVKMRQTQPMNVVSTRSVPPSP